MLPVKKDYTGMIPGTFDQLKSMAKVVAQSGLYRSMDTPEKAFVLMQVSLDHGISPIRERNPKLGSRWCTPKEWIPKSVL